MDVFDRRIARRLAREMGLDEEVIDFDIGVSRPVVALPRPLPSDLDGEHSRVEVAVTARALWLRATWRARREGVTARVPWERVATFGPYKAEGRYKRWSLRGEMVDGTPLAVSLTGRPRPSLLRALESLGVDPGDPGPGAASERP